MRYVRLFATVLVGASVYATGAALAQQDSRDVPLVRRDFSDCSNADVSARDPAIGGTLSVDRGADGNTHVRVILLAQPNTRYHFFLKCVRQLGDLTTQADGFGVANFNFPTNSAGDAFAFDMYPEGAPLGNKFQSVQVNFRQPPVAGFWGIDPPPNQVVTRDVLLAQRDFSDCSNADVNLQDAPATGGVASVDRADGNTHVRVSLAARPNTTYHFFLKCVRLLGDIRTQGDGFAIANFDFATNSAGDVFAFDMYPEGAPSGNKYQSVQVNFAPPPPPVVDRSPRIEYNSQGAAGINVIYANLPAGSEIVLFNSTSGDETPTRTVLAQGGTGTVDLPLANQASGKYYLLARLQADKSYLGQTIPFYVN
jgi:hypothetical protein